MGSSPISCTSVTDDLVVLIAFGEYPRPRSAHHRIGRQGSPPGGRSTPSCFVRPPMSPPKRPQETRVTTHSTSPTSQCITGSLFFLCKKALTTSFLRNIVHKLSFDNKTYWCCWRRLLRIATSTKARDVVDPYLARWFFDGNPPAPAMLATRARIGHPGGTCHPPLMCSNVSP